MDSNKLDSSKTNAMRILDKAGIKYNTYTYDNSDGHIDGVSVAEKIGKQVEQVFKTLVTQGHSGNYYVFVIPVAEELDLKAAARTVGEKSVEMIKVSEINKVTGYIRGGCSPIGMKKDYMTVLDDTSILCDTIVFSAGKIGLQVEVKPDDLVNLIGCKVEPITVLHN
jgi:Cys-tRNA(Pro)/Cys-tRNA(Cys) deacylase